MTNVGPARVMHYLASGEELLVGSIWLQVLPSVVAVLGSGISLTAAIYTVRKNSRMTEEAEALKAATGKDVEILKAVLARTSAQLDADRNYLFESRKRV
jgi:hypothetical protein